MRQNCLEKAPEGIFLPTYEPESVNVRTEPIGQCYFVIDRAFLGRAWGGVRIAVDLTLDEVKVLARTMTLKTILAGIPMGGAKTGVRILAEVTNRDAVISLICRTVGAFVRRGAYFLGTDIGFGEADANAVYALASSQRKLFSGKVSVGEGCAQGILTCIRYAGRISSHPLDHASVALEGLGRISVPTARLLSTEGYIIKAVSNMAGTMYDPNGLNISDLLSICDLEPAELLQTYLRQHPDTTLYPKEAINFIECDILIPGSRTFTIDEPVAKKIQARVICPIANAPITRLGEEVLAERGLISIPDIISNAGGLIASFAQQLGAREHETNAIISEIITHNLETVFRDLRAGEPPKLKACMIAYERLRALDKSEMRSLLGLLYPWVRRLGLTAVLQGIKKYSSLRVSQ